MLNIMMDPRPLYPNLFHFVSPWMRRDMSGSPKHYTRTRRPTKYYFIDFGLSRKYDPTNKAPRAWPIWGADKTVPEFHKSTDPCDPFPTDVYYLGNTLRTVFFKVMPFRDPRRSIYSPIPLGVLRDGVAEASRGRHGSRGSVTATDDGPGDVPV